MLDITDDDVYNALAAFVGMIIPGGTDIERGQLNQVSMPSGPCVILTTVGVPDRIGTNEELTESIDWSADDNAPVDSGNLPAGGSGFAVYVTSDFKYSVQADFYSPDAESWAMSAELLWRSKIAWNAMPPGIKPLYSEGRMQIPLVGGEQQWIQRWTMTLVLDYQPTWSQATQAATTATVVPEPIDVFFPA
jgi:hypothetical protein